MIAACSRAGRRLMVAYRVQYEPHFRLLREMIREDHLGTPLHAMLYFGHNQGDAGQWRLDQGLAGGGALPDIGLYCLNTIQFLAGEEPVEVVATVHSPPGDDRFKEVEESVDWILRFPSGLSATCGASYSVHRSDYCRVMGSAGWAEMNPAFSYPGPVLRTSYPSGEGSRGENIETIRLPKKNQFALEMDHMAECVQTDSVPETPGEQGLRDQYIMDAIYEAARTGKSVALVQTL